MGGCHCTSGFRQWWEKKKSPRFYTLNSSAFKPSSQYTGLGYTMKFLRSFSGNVECLRVTSVVLFTACKQEKGAESPKAGSDETTQRNPDFS
jgi:hypothetical protein